MGLKVNGSEFSWTNIGIVITAIFWLAGLSFKVNANGDDIAKQEETKERLVRIEQKQEDFKEDITEIKDSQHETQATLTAILVAVKKEWH